ncbi:uncharacterized protein HD556DRAFT_1350337 [Suillus plorans]|uniref:Hydrophobin n=1 Tax=Suillus plorans TaxID=116603 RepID=A0A9P7J098_9AGAM|nr:uncharacterized protein HD556DRAFT_1350337 [Suillus plorans]KAG1798424.1 hypothetical protein HD556DRAFT_1350337 [Suillus plorans]
MHFSFLRVVAVVAALTRSTSVTAAKCAIIGQACGTTSPTGLICCDDMFCGPTVSMSRSLCIQNSTPRLTFAPCTNRSPEILPHTARNLESPDEFGKLSIPQ